MALARISTVAARWGALSRAAPTARLARVAIRGSALSEALAVRPLLRYRSAALCTSTAWRSAGTSGSGPMVSNSNAGSSAAGRDATPLAPETRPVADSASAAGASGGAPPPHDAAGPPPPSLLSSPLGWWRANSARLKHMIKSYGYFAVAAYLGVYVVTLAGLYGAVKAGLIRGPEKLDEYVNNWTVKRWLFGDREFHIPPALTQFATAWVLTKTTEPVRLVVTIGILPGLVRRAPAGLLRAFRVPEGVIAARGGGGAAAAGGADTHRRGAAALLLTLGGGAAAAPGGRVGGSGKDTREEPRPSPRAA
jgi:hypothetical protein